MQGYNIVNRVRHLEMSKKRALSSIDSFALEREIQQKARGALKDVFSYLVFLQSEDENQVNLQRIGILTSLMKKKG